MKKKQEIFTQYLEEEQQKRDKLDQNEGSDDWELVLHQWCDSLPVSSDVPDVNKLSLKVVSCVHVAVYEQPHRMVETETS